jgi:hypothetical protein
MLCGAAVVALLASGCERETSAPPPLVDTSDRAAIDESASDLAPAPLPITREEFDSSYSREAETPELPPDVPVYAPASPISSMSSPTRGTIVHLRSEDAVDRVAAWYATELPALGWRLESENGAADSKLVTAVKSARKATVLITGGSDGTQILLTILEQP